MDGLDEGGKKDGYPNGSEVDGYSSLRCCWRIGMTWRFAGHIDMATGMAVGRIDGLEAVGDVDGDLADLDIVADIDGVWIALMLLEIR